MKEKEKGIGKGKETRKQKGKNAPYRALTVRHMVQYAVSHQQHAVWTVPTD